jgi:thymidylate synthase
MSGLQPGIFAHTLVDAHIYSKKPDGSQEEYDHIPGLLQQTTRETRKLPKLIIDPTIRDLKDIEGLMDPRLTTEEVMSHFVLEGYEPHPAISFKVAV